MRGQTGKSHGKGYILRATKGIEPHHLHFFKHNFSMEQEITFVLGKAKEPAIPDVMNNRATAEYNWGGLALLSFV